MRHFSDGECLESRVEGWNNSMPQQFRSVCFGARSLIEFFLCFGAISLIEFSLFFLFLRKTKGEKRGKKEQTKENKGKKETNGPGLFNLNHCFEGL